ncbi:hypothetical protein O1R50_04795 [Glycomyces luteolus]|uniref:Uncharacterized protein n=1 Tax=Glycomyces luteolus TaxID=2670330 RepID=A0A9X3P622_9ACTN|nr:hypothetical protein [Glycomyces luteolus]MDA1358927.1 hypothetical protein [Glycomyces luteolus]
MTRSGERNALEPDPVPVLHRVRELCGRFPEGPLPPAEVKALRESIDTPGPVERTLLPDRRTRTREEFGAYKRERDAALAELAEWVRSAVSGSTADLERLGDRLRRLGDHRRLRFDPEMLGLGLQPEQTRAIALHLLHTGVSSGEIFVGLQLIETVVQPADASLIRTLGHLGRNYGYLASKAVRRLEFPAPHQFALAMRAPRTDRQQFAAALAGSPRADIDALMTTLSVADTIALLTMIGDIQGTPKWIEGNDALAATVVAAAESPSLLGEGVPALMSIACLIDEVAYGTAAFLPYSPGRREQVIAGLESALAAPAAWASVTAALERHPRDSELIWLQRRVLEARRGAIAGFPEGLAIRVAVPPPGSRQEVRTHLLIDGMPLVPRVFSLGVAAMPDRVLQCESGLVATVEPRDVKIADPDCVEECCGALYAEIRRDEAGGRVEWELRRTRSAHEHRERLVFDAAAYDAEIARVSSDFTWEWPARRAARLLRERLAPDLMARWDCRLGLVNSWNSDRSILELSFSYPDAPSSASDRPWLQFVYRTEIPDAAAVDDRAVGIAVERIASQFREGDPKRFAKVVSGSKELAASLGIPW